MGVWAKDIEHQRPGREILIRSGPGLAAAGLSLGLLFLGLWEPLERAVQGQLFALRDRIAPLQWDSRIAVIAIDDDSLAQYGPYPWPRRYYAELLDQLMAVQPAAVGFDILMPEATPDDARLAESIGFSGNVVLAVGGDGLGQSIQVTPTLTEPSQGSFRLGHVKHSPDSDGISRRVYLYERYGSQWSPSFAIALGQTYQTAMESLITQEAAALPEPEIAKFIERPQQFDQDWPVLINWPGRTRDSQQLLTLPFASVMEGGSAVDQLQNRIVLVGYTAVGIVGTGEDDIRTPLEQTVPTAGVYLHAAILDNLLNDRFLGRLPSWGLGAAIVAVAMATSILLKPWSLKGRVGFVAALIPVGFALGYGGLLGGMLLPVATPVGTAFFSLVGLQLLEQRERQTLTDLFAINLSPEMASYVWQHKEELLLEGHIHAQELTATLLFSDIRGFTSITQTLPPKVMLVWLNRYFEAMTECIMAHGGVVDKYIGDAIMAAFGAPVPRSGDGIQQDAQAAVRASVAMAERLKQLNQEFQTEGLPTIRFGIGLHTGEVVAGTVGSRARASYSLFGDAVNVAARLQDQTKQLVDPAAYPILMSEATYRHVKDCCRVGIETQLQLRGRNAQTTAYSLAVS